MGKADIRVFDNDTVVAEKVCSFVIEEANKAIADRGVFTVGLSGGSVAKFLCQGIPSQTTDWSKWRVFFCDERHVPYSDPECTYAFYRDNLFNKVPLNKEYIYPDNPDVTVEEAAKIYEGKLKEVFGGDGIPTFDLLILGMGPDGHTCSLFPGHALLDENKLLVASISDSPKPPPQRITFTYPVLLNSRLALFASCGAGKAEMVKRVLEGQENPPLPAARVLPKTGKAIWFLDAGAASLLAKM